MRLYCAVEDMLFEKYNDLETGGVIESSQITGTVGSPDTVGHACSYHAVWCRNVRILIQEALKSGAHPTTFVDVGSGKGKACLYAAKCGLFTQILGVEFSAPLVEVANRNLRRGRVTNTRFVYADATQFDLPNDPALVFMFNPFDEVILHKFLLRNLETIRATRSLVAYANDKHRHVLGRVGFDALFRDQFRQISLHALRP